LAYLKLGLFQTFSPTSGCYIRSLREWTFAITNES